jgi:hypothetical protein
VLAPHCYSGYQDVLPAIWHPSSAGNTCQAADAVTPRTRGDSLDG